jgi:hypothetical protein
MFMARLNIRQVRGYHNRGDPWQEQRYSGD